MPDSRPIHHALRRSVLPPLLLGCLFAVGCHSVRGALDPEPGGESPELSPPAAAAAAHECSTLDGALAALYDVISGPAGEPRDWARFEGLFHPEWGRLGLARSVSAEGGEVREGEAASEPRFATRPLTPAEYRELAEPLFEGGPFFEREASRVLERYGPIAHAFSTYESRRSADLTEQPFARGINSIQLFNDGTRWWIVSVFWFAESDAAPLPEGYLAE